MQKEDDVPESHRPSPGLVAFSGTMCGMWYAALWGGSACTAQRKRGGHLQVWPRICQSQRKTVPPSKAERDVCLVNPLQTQRLGEISSSLPYHQWIMKKIALIAILINILLFSAVLFAVSYVLSPVTAQSTSTQTMVIPKGAGVSAIGALLQQKNLIRSAWAFRFVVWKNKLAKNLQAGTFDIAPSQSPEEIARALTKGTDDVWVTIVEGLRNEEIAEVLAQTLGPTFDPKEFLRLANGKQGFLFPDTYLVPKMATANSIVNLLQSTFTKKTAIGIQDELQKQNRSFTNAVILASLIQREARTPETMRMIAGILLNRLEKGWPLQVDATLQYIKGYDPKENTWWQTPYAEDKQRKSPYNTYLHSGLPPGPIANPGLHALEAVVNPTPSEYWYYITDDNGVMHYAKTIDEHNANVRKYLR